jgi:glutathione peroxidase
MTIYDFQATAIDGQPQALDAYRGKVLLVVNVASKCVFTSQYAGLEELYKRYRDQGLVVLGFPCDQFRHQEPGGEAEIKSFCEARYGVSFPLFAKVEVNGPDAHPLYKHLKSEKPGIFGTQSIKWNFTKFLVGRDGRVRKRYPPRTSAKRIENDLLPLLDEAA